MLGSCIRRGHHTRNVSLCIIYFILLSTSILQEVLSFSPSLVSNVFHLRGPTLKADERLKFGQCICVSPNGQRIVIGANAYSKFKGAAYIYDIIEEPGTRMEHWKRRFLVGSDTEEAEEKKPRELRVVGRGSGFGFSCTMDSSGQHVVVGAPGHNKQRGQIYVFTHLSEAQKWEESTIIAGPDSRSGDSYGWALDADAKGELLAVSAKGRRANNGEVYVYTCEKGFRACDLRSRISAPDYTDEQGPQGIRIRNNFGVSLALNDVGNILAVGSTGYQGERGVVYVFVQEGVRGNFSLLQRLTSLNPQKAGFFGYRVAMDKTGESIAVGADGEESYRGAVYTYHRRQNASDRAMFEDQREIIHDSGQAEDNFGGSVTMSGDGKVLFIGAPGANRGGSEDHGTVHIYEAAGSEWKYTESIHLPDDHTKAGNFFGWSSGSSYSANRFAATAPDAFNELGMAFIAGFNTYGKKKVDSRSIANDDVASLYHDEL